MSQLREDILNFAKAAGNLAVSKQRGITREFKPDSSVLTETDLAVAKLFHEMLGHYKDQGHLLLDEETLHAKTTSTSVLADAEYTWILDPIDGTTPYSLGRPSFGHLLGVLKNGKPHAGLMYMPAQQVLIYADADEQWVEWRPFTSEAERQPLSLNELPLHPMNMLEIDYPDIRISEVFLAENWVNKPESAVQAMMAPVLGQASGTVAGPYYSIWDLAGGWCVGHFTGYELRSFEGVKIDQLTPAHFEDNWKLGFDFVFAGPATMQEILKTTKQHSSRPLKAA